MRIKIFITTYGRRDKQITFSHLPESVKRHTLLVVSKGEADYHLERNRKVLICPVQGKGLTGVRQWILEYCNRKQIRKMILLDDDLQPETKRSNNKIKKSNSKEVKEGFNWLATNLNKYAHCAWSERSMYWSVDRNIKFIIGNKGICCVGYDVKKLIKLGCAFNYKTPNNSLMSDYHMTLQLFRVGEPNIVSLVHKYRNPMAMEKAGGSEKFRNSKTMEEASKRLEKLYPDFVKAVEKQTKVSFGGKKHWDVRIQWKKACEAGLNTK